MSVNVKLYCGDNRVSLRRLIDEGVRVHSVVTDPPYGLVSVQKRLGAEGAAPASAEGNDGSFARLSGGFMGKAWDASGIERDPEFWKLIWEILLPGGYCFAFSGSRTGHWQACAMEQAGFIMHPMHGWVFGSGFPKAHNAARAIEATMLTGGAAPKNMRMLDMGENYRPHELAGTPDYGKGRMSRGADTDRDYNDRPDLTTPEARQWEGWAYGTQAQKPALEPIYLGQKPFSEKTGAANLLKHGVGAVNIDGCRVPLNGETTVRSTGNGNRGRDDGWGMEGGAIGGSSEGRHPANLILDGSPEVVAMFPGENARFFHQFPPDTDPVIYQPKAGKEDRAGSKHPTVKPVALMQYLIRHITPPGGTVLDPFAGSGTTAEAAKREGFDCILMEAEDEYVEFLRHRFTGDFFCNVEVHDASRGGA